MADSPDGSVTGSAPGANTMGDAKVLDPVWNRALITGFLLTAAIILVTWLTPATRTLWDAFDVAIYRALNDSLEWGKAWQGFWAIANWRPFDLLAGGAAIFLVALWIRGDDGRHARERLAAVCLFGAWIGITKIVSFYIVEEMLQYARLSPTWIFEGDGAKRLFYLVTWIKTKDASGHSYPGDHAMVLTMVMILLTTLGDKRRGWIAFWALSPFILPRLVSGAHWITDVLAGALPIALISTAIWFGTPLHAHMARLCVRLFNPLLGWGVRLLGVKNSPAPMLP